MIQADVADTVAVSPEDPLLNRQRLEPFLRSRLGINGGEIGISRFRNGNANISFLVSSQIGELVLRRPPMGPLPPKAHDMEREFRVLQIVHPRFDLAPKPLLFCDDREILDAPFLVMERRNGVVLRGSEPDILARDPQRNHLIAGMMIEMLARFHRVNPQPMIDAKLGNPDGFAKRQLAGWTTRMRAGNVDPRLDRIVVWLENHLPAPARSTILHNDFKLDNIVVSADEYAKPVALLDWDLCTVGDPLFDLGLLLSYWVQSDDPTEWRLGASMPTTMPGFPGRGFAAERYAALTGADISSIQWYVVFANFRIIVALLQIHHRYLSGQNRDPRFASLGERIEIMTRKTFSLIQKRKPDQKGVLL